MVQPLLVWPWCEGENVKYHLAFLVFISTPSNTINTDMLM